MSDTITISNDDMNYIKNQFELMAREIKTLTQANEVLEEQLKQANQKLEPTPISEVLSQETLDSFREFVFNK